MKSKTKTLIAASLFIIILGFIFLWFSLKTPEKTIIPSSAVQSTVGEKVMVAAVIDGDTIELEGGQKVRLIGIDTPETVDPRRPVGCFGKEASSKTKELLYKREIILEKDVTDADKYQRLLRYIYLPVENGQMLFINDYLVREGFAKVYTFPPDVKYTKQLIEAERQARENKKGLWKKCL